MPTTLTRATKKLASKLPMLAELLDAIVGKAPAAATQMLKQLKDGTCAGAELVGAWRFNSCDPVVAEFLGKLNPSANPG